MPHPKIRTETITIASGATTEAINLKDRVLVGVITPASISSTALTISAAPSKGGTYVTVQDGLGQYGAAGDVTFTIASSKHLSIPPTLTANLSWIKLVFDSSETAKTFTYVAREI